jgi:hypothetical protein
VNNIKEMVSKVQKHANDEYSNGKLVKYKKMVKDSKKSFYHGCVVRYMRLFAMVKLFQLKASNRWSDDSFKDLLTLQDMLPQGNAVPETVYEAKQITISWVWTWKRFTCARMIAFYIVGMCMKALRNVIFVDSTNSIVEKIAVMTRNAIEEIKGQD